MMAAAPQRRPVPATLRMTAAPVVARWTRARSPVLTVGAFALLSAAAWTLHITAGLAAIGVSLLILDYLASE